MDWDVNWLSYFLLSTPESFQANLGPMSEKLGTIYGCDQMFRVRAERPIASGQQALTDSKQTEAVSTELRHSRLASERDSALPDDRRAHCLFLGFEIDGASLGLWLTSLNTTAAENTRAASGRMVKGLEPQTRAIGFRSRGSHGKGSTVNTLPWKRTGGIIRRTCNSAGRDARLPLAARDVANAFFVAFKCIQLTRMRRC